MPCGRKRELRRAGGGPLQSIVPIMSLDPVICVVRLGSLNRHFS
jgi:hypothetical protein